MCVLSLIVYKLKFSFINFFFRLSSQIIVSFDQEKGLLVV